jgi:hypothetical protein
MCCLRSHRTCGGQPTTVSSSLPNPALETYWKNKAEFKCDALPHSCTASRNKNVTEYRKNEHQSAGSSHFTTDKSRQACMLQTANHIRSDDNQRATHGAICCTTCRTTNWRWNRIDMSYVVFATHTNDLSYNLPYPIYESQFNVCHHATCVFEKESCCDSCDSVLLDLEERIKKKRKWCENWFLKRNLYSHMKLLWQLRENEPHDLKNYLRMDNDTYRYLLELVRNKISRQTTNMRNSINAEERLTATLRIPGWKKWV